MKVLVPEEKWNRKQIGHLKQQDLEGARQHAQIVFLCNFHFQLERQSKQNTNRVAESVSVAETPPPFYLQKPSKEKHQTLAVNLI